MLIEFPVVREGMYRVADLVVKAASGIGVVVGGVWAVYRYLGGVGNGRPPVGLTLSHQNANGGSGSQRRKHDIGESRLDS